MKRTLLIMTLAAATVVATAQKGNWYVGGVAGYASHTFKAPSAFKTTTSNWALGPEVGTFLKDDIQLGFVLGLGGSSVKDDNKKINMITNFSPTAYVRRFFKLTDNFSAFAGFYVNY